MQPEVAHWQGPGSARTAGQPGLRRSSVGRDDSANTAVRRVVYHQFRGDPLFCAGNRVLLSRLIEETVRHCCDGDFASSIASRRPWFWHSLCRKTGPPDSLPKSQPRMVATPPNIARDCEVGHKGSDPNKRRIM